MSGSVASGPTGPVFVVGFQRSGTTLLQALLGAHPAIAAPPETYFFFRIYDLRDYWGDLADDAVLHRVIDEMIHPALPLFAECGFDTDRLFERVSAGPRTYRAVFEAMMGDFADRAGKRRWSDKTPGQEACRAWELFPEAQVVHIVRDPRDVVASSVAAPWESDDAATIARRYRDFTLRNVADGAAAGPARYLRIRYEDLCAGPRWVMRVVCAFLDEDYDEGILSDPQRRSATIAPVAAPWQRRALDVVSPPVEGGWRQRLRRVDRARVTAIVESLAVAHGYRPGSPRARSVGAAMNAAIRPAESLRARLAGWRTRRLSRTPAARYELVQHFQREQVSRVTRS